MGPDDNNECTFAAVRAKAISSTTFEYGSWWIYEHITQQSTVPWYMGPDDNNDCTFAAVRAASSRAKRCSNASASPMPMVYLRLTNSQKFRISQQPPLLFSSHLANYNIQISILSKSRFSNYRTLLKRLRLAYAHGISAVNQQQNVRINQQPPLLFSSYLANYDI